jgi:hypothetical protein
VQRDRPERRRLPGVRDGRFVAGGCRASNERPNDYRFTLIDLVERRVCMLESAAAFYGTFVD